MKSAGIGDTAYFGPELVYFLHKVTPSIGYFNDESQKEVYRSWDEISNKYKVAGEEVAYRLKDCTIHTPIIRDMASMKGLLSISGLQASYDRMKFLRKKHNNSVKSLEALLR